jgi:hypothetical protein
MLTPLRQKQREWLCAIAAVSLPVLAQLIWLLHNTQLPVADADEQLSASYHVYKHLARHEWMKFICELYHVRTNLWRPTGFYVLQVPFQILSGGDLMFTTRATTLLCTFASCLYLYRLLRLAVDRTPAILGTTLIGLLPCTQWPGTMLGFSETGFLPAMLASAYHFIRSDNLENRRHRMYFIMAVVVAFAIRPVEALFHLCLPFLIFLMLSWRQGKVSTGELYRIAFGALASASILIVSGIVNYKIESHSPIFKDPAQAKSFTGTAVMVTGMTLALWAASGATRFYRWRRAGNRFSAVESSFLTIYALVVLFYLPFVPKLVEWVYTCSFGSLAALMPQRPPAYMLIAGFIQDAGTVPFLATTLFGAASFCFCLHPEQRTALFRHKLFYLFAFIPVTLLVTLHSVQFLQRKVTVIVDIFLLAFLIPALMRGRFRHTRIALLTAIAAAQLYGVTLTGLDKPREKWLAEFTGGAYPRMLTLSPNPNMVVFDFLESVARHNGYTMIALPVSTTGDIDPFLLSLLVEDMDNGIHAGFSYQSSYDSETPAHFLHGKEEAFLLIKDIEGDFMQSPQEVDRLKASSAADRDPSDRLMLDLQALYAADRFKDAGVIKKDCVHIDTVHREACIFEIRKPGHP